MIEFLRGGLAVSCLVSGLFFWKFWSQVGDRLFAMFAIAFWILALNWIAIGIVDVNATATSEASTHFIYLVRLAAFALIIVAVVDKNRRSRSS